MTISFQRFPASGGLLSDEDVLCRLRLWQAEGRRTALVTLIGIEGGAPRHPGAQMAVAEDGSYVGYLSGGCLEQAVALEAQAVIEARRNRIVRYGKGSPYVDIRLPCGSGLDLYFDQAIDPACVAAMIAHRTSRRPFVLRTTISSGASAIEIIEQGETLEQSGRDGDLFTRTYAPDLRLLLLGNGPALTGIAKLAAATGLELAIQTTDEATRSDLAAAGHGAAMDDRELGAAMDRLDFASAAVLLFHDHEQEPDLIARLLETDCFYIGALGNHAVHRARLATLAARGLDATTLARIRAPVGSIAGAKSRATLAIGVLAEMLGEAKARNLIA